LLTLMHTLYFSKSFQFFNLDGQKPKAGTK
jgi:hypothetical protein